MTSKSLWLAKRSELVVHSGHNVCEKVDAQREVVRILRLELQGENAVAQMTACSPVMLRNETESFTTAPRHAILFP